MKRSLLGMLVSLAQVGTARAESAEAHTQLAVEAAQAGNCEVVLYLAPKVQAADETYYWTTFVADAGISACLYPPDAPASSGGALSPEPSSAAPGAGHPDSYTPAVTTTAPPKDVRPPTNGGRLVGEFLAGGALGVGGAFVGAYLGYGLATSNGCDGEYCGLGGLVLGGYLGYAVAAPLGVYAVGAYGDQDGSLAAALGGSLLGGLAGVGMLLVASAGSGGGQASEVLAGVALVAGPPVGAMIGFNLTRRYERPAPRYLSWTPTASVTHERSLLGVAGRF